MVYVRAYVHMYVSVTIRNACRLHSIHIIIIVLLMILACADAIHIFRHVYGNASPFED